MSRQGLHVMQCPDRGLKCGKKRQGPEVEVAAVQVVQVYDVRLLEKRGAGELMTLLKTIVQLPSQGRPGMQSCILDCLQIRSLPRGRGTGQHGRSHPLLMHHTSQTLHDCGSAATRRLRIDVQDIFHGHLVTGSDFCLTASGSAY